MLLINAATVILCFITTVNCLYLSDYFKFRQKRIDKRSAADKMIIVLHENGGIYGLENTKVFHFVIQPNFAEFENNSNESFVEPNLMEVEEVFQRSDITHVANGGKYTVYAMVEKDKDYLRNITKRFFEEAERSNWQMPDLPSSLPFTHIRSGSFEGFNPRARSNQKVYITVFSHDILTGKIEKISDAYEVMSGSGVVIGYDNKIHDVKDGKLWVDPTGKSHSRRPQNV